jgi:hypothetical protein
MWKALPLVLLLVPFAIPDQAAAQPGWPGPMPPRGPVPNLAGVWYMHGDPNLPTEIVQPMPDGRALFVNEKGDRAWGEIHGDRVWIPRWSDGRSRGLVGVLRGDRIVWPNGTYWSRWPEGPFWPR